MTVAGSDWFQWIAAVPPCEAVSAATPVMRGGSFPSSPSTLTFRSRTWRDPIGKQPKPKTRTRSSWRAMIVAFPERALIGIVRKPLTSVGKSSLRCWIEPMPWVRPPESLRRRRTGSSQLEISGNHDQPRRPTTSPGSTVFPQYSSSAGEPPA